jgi:hypothetical protein
LPAVQDEVWKPGSFTKNFSWGEKTTGLLELHEIIRKGFDNKLEDTPRKLFRKRIAEAGRPDLIPINFFLFNRTENGTDYICVDELVFQALTWDHNPAFDRLALFAFIFSYAGRWKAAAKEQRRPAMWANAYVREHLATNLKWQRKSINADDIQKFVSNDQRYKAETSRKLATNLNYLLHIGKIWEFAEAKVTRWWVDCLFLALDRIIEDAILDGKRVSADSNLVDQTGFYTLTGGLNSEKSLATKHLTRLYDRLGGRRRFNAQSVVGRTQDLLDIQPAISNDDMPRGAIHLTNPRILKSIPSICADLARNAGFDVISAMEVDGLDLGEFVSARTESALALLRASGVEPNLTVEEFLKLTRDQ